MRGTTVRIDVATHEEMKRLASRLGSTVGETVALAVRRLCQDQIGQDLSVRLIQVELDWLNADVS